MTTLRSCTAVCMLALPSVASADVVHFNNVGGDFGWGMDFGLTVGDPYLDITRDAAQSGRNPVPHAFVYFFRQNITSTDWSADYLQGRTPALLIAGGETVFVTHNVNGGTFELPFTPPQLFAPGDFVGESGQTFITQATVRGSTQQGNTYFFDLVEETDYYVGVQFEIEGEAHYGWVHLIDSSQHRWPDPVEWAYETTPNQPIRVGAFACPADFDTDGTLSSSDFFAFLSAFFSQTLDADFNQDEVVDTRDFFDYLAAFFAGCE